MAKAGFNILKVFIVFRDKIANFNYHIKDLFSFLVNRKSFQPRDIIVFV